jgi:hypothetical protein
VKLITVTFNDVVNITPGDDEEYSRVLVALGRATGVNSWPASFFDDCHVPGAAVKSLYDNDAHGQLKELLLSHPGLGEERVCEAVRTVVAAVKDNPTRSDLQGLPYGVLANPTLTRDMVSKVVQVAELLPSHAVNEFLKSVKPTEDDVVALWECQSRRYPFVEQSQCDFVDIATRCGLAPDSLVEQWLGSEDYAPYAAAHATNISEDDVLAIAGKPGCSYVLRNPVLSHGALWREAKRRCGAWTDLAHLFANEGAPPALLDAGARDEEYQWVWKSIASNPAATRAAFEALLFTGGSNCVMIACAKNNPGFPPDLVRDVYMVFGEETASGFVSASAGMLRDLAQWHGTEAGGAVTAVGCRVAIHRNCSPDVRRSLVEGLKRMWPLVAYDAYRGRL